MNRSEVSEALKTYIVDEILDGDDSGLDEKSPLLAWGVLSSLEIVRLRAFVRDRFEVDLTIDHAQPERFENIAAIADLIMSSPAESED